MTNSDSIYIEVHLYLWKCESADSIDTTSSTSKSATIDHCECGLLGTIDAISSTDEDATIDHWSCGLKAKVLVIVIEG